MRDVTRASDPRVETQARLSRRELDVLEMTARGMTNSQVGASLNVSVHAVKFHLGSIYRKLKVANRTEAAIFYMRTIAPAEHSHQAE